LSRSLGIKHDLRQKPGGLIESREEIVMEAPEGLHELEYARHILEEVLGWPAKGNLELVGDCIRAISISRKLSLLRAHAYLLRAIKLAREQQIPVDKFFFQDGKYTDVRPAKESAGIPFYKPQSLEERAAFEAHKQTPEYKTAQQELERAWAKLAGRATMGATA
jgi:hypothetical protein